MCSLMPMVNDKEVVENSVFTYIDNRRRRIILLWSITIVLSGVQFNSTYRVALS